MDAASITNTALLAAIVSAIMSVFPGVGRLKSGQKQALSIGLSIGAGIYSLWQSGLAFEAPNISAYLITAFGALKFYYDYVSKALGVEEATLEIRDKAIEATKNLKHLAFPELTPAESFVIHIRSLRKQVEVGKLTVEQAEAEAERIRLGLRTDLKPPAGFFWIPPKE